MQIRFSLPQAGGGMSVGYLTAKILYDLDQWSRHYCSDYEYTVTECQMTVELKSPQDYTVFNLTWRGHYYTVSL